VLNQTNISKFIMVLYSADTHNRSVLYMCACTHVMHPHSVSLHKQPFTLLNRPPQQFESSKRLSNSP